MCHSLLRLCPEYYIAISSYTFAIVFMDLYHHVRRLTLICNNTCTTLEPVPSSPEELIQCAVILVGIL